MSMQPELRLHVPLLFQVLPYLAIISCPTTMLSYAPFYLRTALGVSS